MVIKSDARSLLVELERYNTKFDIIFMDPPYNKSLEETLLALENSSLIHDKTIIIVEASKKQSLNI